MLKMCNGRRGVGVVVSEVMLAVYKCIGMCCLRREVANYSPVICAKV